MATTTCTEFTLYESTKKAEEIYFQKRDAYLSYIEEVYQCCYHCAASTNTRDAYEFLLEHECSHCENDFILVDENHFVYLLEEAVYQSADEVKIQDQDTVSHNVQPNMVALPKVAYSEMLFSIPPSMENIYNRSYLLTNNIAWNTGHIPGTRLAFKYLPVDLFVADFPIHGIFQYHGVTRANIEMEVRINSNPFVCGQLVMTAMPNDFFTPNENQYTQSVELYPHSYLNAGYETNAKMIVPYVAPHVALFNIGSSGVNNYMGWILSVWNQLHVAAGQPVDYNFSIWFKILEVEVGIKMPPTATKTAYQAAEHANALSNIGSAIANSGVPIISSIAKVVGGVTGLFDAPIQPMTVANVNVTTDVPRVAYDMRYIADNYVGERIYEMVDLKKYISTYGRLYIDSWNTSSTTSSLLFELSTTFDQTRSSSPNVGGYQVPLLEAGRHFRFWRGGLKFKVHIVATRFHQGQLLISWTPFGRCTTLAQAKAAYYTSIDIGQENVFECEIPFVYPVDYMYTDQTTHGFLQFWVQNPLIAPQNVSTTVSVNIYMCAGDDFEFAGPQDPSLAVYQASESGTGASSIWRPFPTIPLAKKRMQGHTDLRSFLRRPSRSQSYSITLTNTPENTNHDIIARLPYIQRGATAETQEFTFWPVRALMCSGSVRWSFSTDLPLNARAQFHSVINYKSNVSQMTVYATGQHVPNTAGLSDSLMRSGVTYNHLQSPGERVTRIELPAYNAIEFVPLYHSDGLIGTPSIDLHIRRHEDLDFTITFYWEAGDDFEIHWPLSGPVRSIPSLVKDKPVEEIKESETPTDEDEPPTPADRILTLEVDGFGRLVKYVTAREIAGMDPFPSVSELQARERADEREETAQYQSLSKFYCDDEDVSHQGVSDFIVGSLSSILAYLTSISKYFTEGYHTITSAIAKAYGLAVDAAETIVWFSTLRETITFMVDKLLPAITAIYTAWHAQGVFQQVALLQLSTMIFNFSSPEKLKEDVKERATPQGPDSEPCVTGIVTEGCRTLLKTVWKALGFTVSNDYDLYISRVTRGMKPSSWEYCITILGHSVLYLIHGKSLNVEWEREVQIPYLEVVKKFNMDKINGCFSGQELHIKRGKQTNFEILESYYKAMEKYLDISTDVRIPPTITSTIESIRRAYTEAKRIERIEPDQAEPVGVMFLGGPGCGKSFLLSVLLPTMLIRKKCVIARKNPLFTLPVGDQDTYWNNYNGQEMIAMDDAFQERDGTDPLTLINLINTTRPAIPAASLENKGMQFEGRVVMISTNQQNCHNLTKILDHKALVRRFPVCYRLICHKKNEEGRFDPDDLAALVEKSASGDYMAELELTKYINDTWTFVPHNFSSGGVKFPKTNSTSVTYNERYGDERDDTDVTSTFHDVVNEIADAVIRNERIHKQMGKFKTTPTISDDAAVSQGMSWGKLPVEVPVVINDEEESEDEGISIRVRSNSPIPHVVVARDKTNAAPDFVAGLKDTARDKEAREGIIELLATMEDDNEPDENLDYYKELLNTILACYPEFKSKCLTGKAFSDFPAGDQEVLLKVYLHGTREDKKKTWKGILGILGVAALTGTALFVAFKTFSSFFKNVLIPKLQSYTGDNAMGRSRVNLGNKSVTHVVGKASYQNEETYPDTHTFIHNNMVTIEITRFGTTNGQSISALFLDDHSFVCNQHLVDTYFQWSDEGTCTVGINRKIRGVDDYTPIRLEKNYCINVPVNEEPSDLCYVHLRVPVSRMKKITHLIYSNSDATFQDYECYIKGGSGTYHNGNDVRGTVTRLVKFANTTGVFYEINSPERTQAGDCGRPYLLSAYKHARPLFGIHAILSSKGPGCVPLVYEDLAKVSQRFQGVHLDSEEVTMNCTVATSKYWESSTPLYSDLVCNDVSVRHHAPTESNLKPLKYNGELLKHQDWECPMIPAALKPRDGKHPLITNAQKYDCQAIFAMNGNIHNVVLDHYVNKLEKNRDISVYPIEVAINGNSVMNNLQYNTGCGYWAQFGFRDGKKEFFSELPQEIDPINGENLPIRRIFSDKSKQHIVPIWDCTFVQRLQQCEDLIRKGTCFTTFWISSNKDELRNVEKVRACKTRVFEQPGLEYTLLVRRYFGAFLDYFKTRSGFTFYHGIGADKEVVWNEYRLKFLENSDIGHAFDYRNFDGSVNADAFQFFDDFVGAYYSGAPPEDHLARKCLVRILRDANHVMGPYFFQSSQGNKSGNPFTDVFNSVCNYYIMSTAYCVARVTRGLQPTMINFDRDIKMLTYGDDIAMTVKRSALDYFNGPVIEQILACYGYKITDAKKTGVIPPYIDFSEITFLKCPFVEHKNVTLAPIPKSDIYKELCYAPKSCIGDSGDVQQRILNTLRFMSHHGANSLREFKSQLRERGIPRGWLSQSFESFVEDMENKQTRVCLH